VSERVLSCSVVFQMTTPTLKVVHLRVHSSACETVASECTRLAKDSRPATSGLPSAHIIIRSAFQFEVFRSAPLAHLRSRESTTRTYYAACVFQKAGGRLPALAVAIRKRELSQLVRGGRLALQL
jgi:hypothetical protein